MELLNENRLLIHTGKFLRQPETGFGWSRWTELFVFLFDNYRRSCGCLSASPAQEPFDSCYDETQGERWSHEVPSIPTGKSPPISD